MTKDKMTAKKKKKKTLPIEKLKKTKPRKTKEPAPPPKPVHKKPSKEEKLIENYRKVTEQFLFGKQYRPLSFSDLQQKLSIIETHEEHFKKVLEHLTHQGRLVMKQGLYHVQGQTSLPNSLTGIIRMNPRGFGFVQVDNPQFGEDVFIPRHSTKQAIDGDKVEIVVSESQFSEKGPEGRVVSILSRSRSHLAGTILGISQRFAQVHVPMIGSERPVLLELSKSHPLKRGDRVVMEVIDWGSLGSETRCRLSRKIGHISEPECDVPAAIAEFDIPFEFPQPVLKEIKSFGKTVPEKAFQGREDLRELETFTIDPDTAKDYDDAISLSKDKKGIYHLGVHIADVSHYVQPGTALDQEAFLRANSTYFPGKCIPMLPSELSDNLCSLKPKVNRLTVTAFMDFDATGEMVNYRLVRSVIHSAKRFTYREAKLVLEGKKKSPHSKTILLMQELCFLLKKKRYERGSVEFAMPELVILVDEKGVPTGTDYVEYDITHQIVEEFMLKANETVAKHLDTLGKGVPFRVHDEPSEENMRDFSLLANAFGFKLPPKPTSKDIQKLFDEALHTSYGQYLATSYIRRMRLAVYSPVNIGHFGLALTHYCHFTSPIRRYVDLVAHRLIFELPCDIQALHKIADKCSERERISAKAEGSVVVLKKYRLLDAFAKDDPKRTYRAVITRVKPFGIYFEILELMLEGFIHISEIGDDYYIFLESDNKLIGDMRGEMFSSGEKISVRLRELDLITCESKWKIARGVKNEGEEK